MPKMMFCISTDLPLPVEPAIRVCGALIFGDRNSRLLSSSFTAMSSSWFPRRTIRVPPFPDFGQVKDAAVRSGDSDGDDARLGADGNHVQPVRGEELGASPEHLLDGEVRAALELQQRSVRRQRAAEELRLKLELLQRAFTQALDLLEPVGIGGAVLRAAVIIREQLARPCG